MTSVSQVTYRGPNAARELVVDRLRLSALWLVGTSGAFVMIEPAPYEFLFALAAVVFVATGLKLHTGHVPLLVLLILYNVGFMISLAGVVELPGTASWTAVSCYLSLTALFFATVLAEDTERRLDCLLRGYILAAVIACIIAILGYFELMPGWAAFLGSERARSTFKDPNVFGPFVILPLLLLLQRMLFGGMREFLRNAPFALLIIAGLLLSFSRGAWGHVFASALIMLTFMYITTRSQARRARIIVIAVISSVLIVGFVLALLSIEQVRTLFEERASLLQDYDTGATGRFGRHLLGALLVLDHPFGIGPLQFSSFFPEDPHNSFLLSFTAGGWLGGCVFIALVLLTLRIGWKQVFIRTPWQGTAIAIYAFFVGEVAESYFIDVQHWRHYYLIIGAIWGLAIAARLLEPFSAAQAHAAFSPPLPAAITSRP